MFPEQLDIASQLILRWDRFGAKVPIDTADEFTICLPKHTSSRLLR